MGKMDGVTMARKIRQENEDVQIVFITGYTDYIAEGYEVSALHYLLKPVEEEKLFAVLDRAVGRLRKNDRFLTLELPQETLRIFPLQEIRYMEVWHNNCDGSRKRGLHAPKTLKGAGGHAGRPLFPVRTVIPGKSLLDPAGHKDRGASGGRIHPSPAKRRL